MDVVFEFSMSFETEKTMSFFYFSVDVGCSWFGSSLFSSMTLVTETTLSPSLSRMMRTPMVFLP